MIRVLKDQRREEVEEEEAAKLGEDEEIGSWER